LKLNKPPNITIMSGVFLSTQVGFPWVSQGSYVNDAAMCIKTIKSSKQINPSARFLMIQGFNGEVLVRILW